ncbi:redoxin domain-containing protein [Pedobacter sp. BMA]|uniref:redoxin domain-containing protein n=1 Tax=Pedobacter sp. BMA TaxID=1663685 RepID=UPI00064B7BB5|nr:redoxin domain-containing protein [Pedobacter sp. BMA]KLT65489.1 hypothetical protein AB669_10460 [Pedobacter sp. BMA]
MKYFFALGLIFGFISLNAQSYTAVRNVPDDIIKLKPTVAQRTDTNQLYFDDNGVALSYTQFNKLLISGQYVAKPADEITNPRRISLKKLSSEAYEKLNHFIRDNTSIQNEHISTGKKLDVSVLIPHFKAARSTNQVLVQIYWYAGCKSCDESLTQLSAFVKELDNPKNLSFAIITTDDIALVNKKLANNPIPNAEIIGSGKTIADAYEITEFPAYIVSDKSQMIRYAVAGSSRLTIPDLKTAIKTALSE